MAFSALGFFIERETFLSAPRLCPKPRDSEYKVLTLRPQAFYKASILPVCLFLYYSITGTGAGAGGMEGVHYCASDTELMQEGWSVMRWV